MRLNQCTDEEQDVLRQIIALAQQGENFDALAQQLPLPLTNYTQALGHIRAQEFGINGRRRHRQEKVECRR